jgi:hypothetical protein
MESMYQTGLEFAKTGRVRTGMAIVAPSGGVAVYRIPS